LKQKSKLPATTVGFVPRCRLQLTILVLVFRTIRRWLKSRRCWKRGARLVLLVKWRPEAIVALIEIIDYIEQYNPVAAVSLHQTIVVPPRGCP